MHSCLGKNCAHAFQTGEDLCFSLESQEAWKCSKISIETWLCWLWKGLIIDKDKYKGICLPSPQKTLGLLKILPMKVDFANNGSFLPCVLKVWSSNPSLHQAGLCVKWLDVHRDPGGGTSAATPSPSRGADGSRGVPAHRFPSVDRTPPTKWESLILWIVQKTNSSSAWKVKTSASL